MATWSLKASSDGPTEPSKCPKRMQICDLYDKVIQNNIETDEQLCQQALQEKGKGNNKLANILLSKHTEQLNSVLCTTRIMQNASAVLSRKCKTRNQTLEEANSTECISGCEGS